MESRFVTFESSRVEHSAPCVPEGALVLDVFLPCVRNGREPHRS
jgi:hypothetical protein